MLNLVFVLSLVSGTPGASNVENTPSLEVSGGMGALLILPTVDLQLRYYPADSFSISVRPHAGHLIFARVLGVDADLRWHSSLPGQRWQVSAGVKAGRHRFDYYSIGNFESPGEDGTHNSVSAVAGFQLGEAITIGGDLWGGVELPGREREGVGPWFGARFEVAWR